ncbi:UbiH/UbiF/VisC/COQ6 family ubiquinone biosynthesis hydroxylase [Pleionea sp. CnH1-48]|uniref:UbiH/UbiF/VisC/COQ6 family ubiquinone biosynthesis hydroxylase n=1 Tax=Pleionea sp. CnH1-48 TaxID=2954494 RepID=UPI00209805D5|nr:UbiH/UbiF/VisC/COQ6 family ubiquinone biosynthesis hydroxylase [Pleionea sp. CnH1-48]MCO7226223.1 UbiH/UbiF/VisC/COQ6 family ubiquinone biosynthesis hydroxylase [Pleionea sp. CnH1-48]
MAEKVDIAIVGAGMVGLALAALLKQQGLSITLIDAQDFPAPSVDGKYDSRVSAIARSSENILRNVGAWQHLPPGRCTPYDAMRVWEQNGSAELRFSAQELAEPDLGYIVENSVLRQALVSSIGDEPNVRFRMATKLEEVEWQPQKVKLVLANGERIEAKLLVGADGALSKIRQMGGFETDELNYHQLALVANLRCENHHELTAWQRFLPSGPIAFLPLPEANLCSIVWSLDKEIATEILAAEPEVQQSRIAAAFDYRLGAVELTTPLAGFPLVARHAERYLDHRVALIGDAAHTIHPLAGQGVNLGFLDAAELAQEIVSAHKQQRDIGDIRFLRAFERRRKTHNHLIQKSMTALNWVYGQSFPALVVARNLGVNLLNQHPLAKAEFMRRAMGIKGHIPELAKAQ